MHCIPPLRSYLHVETTLGKVGCTFLETLSNVQGLIRRELNVLWKRDPGGGRPGLCHSTVTRECRTGRWIHFGSMSTLLRTLIVNSDSHVSGLVRWMSYYHQVLTECATAFIWLFHFIQMRLSPVVCVSRYELHILVIADGFSASGDK